MSQDEFPPTEPVAPVGASATNQQPEGAPETGPTGPGRGRHMGHAHPGRPWEMEAAPGAQRVQNVFASAPEQMGISIQGLRPGGKRADKYANNRTGGGRAAHSTRHNRVGTQFAGKGWGPLSVERGK